MKHIQRGFEFYFFPLTLKKTKQQKTRLNYGFHRKSNQYLFVKVMGPFYNFNYENTENVPFLESSPHSSTAPEPRWEMSVNVLRLLIGPMLLFGSSAGQQARRIVDKTAELVGQVSLVFWQKAAHF